jgi:UDP-glucuronate decarboxylase
MPASSFSRVTRQPYAIICGIILIIFIWYQLTIGKYGLQDQSVSNHNGNLNNLNVETIIKQLVKSEVVATLSEPTKHTTYTNDMTMYPPVQNLPEMDRLRILVTGGAGFVGSHLVDRLMIAGHHVIVADNMFTGRQKNVGHWIGHPNFQLIIHDVVEPIMLEVDQIYHLACPASPPHYQYNPIKTIKTSTEGTLNMLGLAKRTRVSVISSNLSALILMLVIG